MNKNIILLHPSLNPAGGGEQVVLQLIRVLIKNAYNVKLFSIEKTDWKTLDKTFANFIKPNEEFSLLKKAPRTGIEIIDSFIITTLFITLLIYTKFTFNELQINTCGEKINSVSDIVYVNAIPLRSAYLLDSTRLYRKIMSRIYGKFITIFDILSPAKLLISNSKFNQNLIKKSFNQNSEVVYPPIDLSRIIYDKIEKKNSVVVVTRYLPEQGLEIVPYLALKLESVHFTLIGPTSVGSQDLINRLEKKCQEYGVQERVQLLLNQPFTTYVSTLFGSKILLRTLPSEPFGISIIEGMAAGCVPIVRKGSGAWVDILEEHDGQYGFGFLDEQDAVVKIIQVLSDDELLKLLQDRIRVRVKYFQNLNFEANIINLVEKVSNQLMKS